MHHRLLAALLLSPACLPASAAITLLGTGQIPATATDTSGFTGLLEDGVTPHNQIGGLGSALAYSGQGNVYYATPDRGPADGATRYVDRVYKLSIGLTPIAPYGTNSYSITPTVTDTVLLSPGGKLKYRGSATAFDPTNSTDSLRFDPEGIRVAACRQSAYISDEYGPYLYRFNLQTGLRTAAIPLPNKLLLDAPSANPTDELSNNVFGRQANRGMEGLAINADGTKLYGLMQSPLIQDGGLNALNERVGTNARLVEITLATGAVREFLYTLDHQRNGLNEVLAINDDEFLVIERDGRTSANTTFKKVFKINISGATDIRNLKAMPSTGLPSGVTAVTKSLFIDLLSSEYGLAANIPEKIEGLAFGPKIAGDRQTLIVSSDNDFFPTQPSNFYVFGIDAADLPNFQPQKIRSCNN